VNAAIRSELAEATTGLLEYLAVADPPEPADIIWGLGSHDDRVPRLSAGLYHRGLSPLIVFSGGRGHRWAELADAEADLFARTAIDLGVPADRIVVENRSSNTAENIRFSLAVLDARPTTVTSAIVVTIPPFQRRASITVHTHRPAIRCINCPVDWGSASEWTDDELVLVARLCAGEFERLQDYPRRGFLDWDPNALPRHVVTAAAAIERGLQKTRAI